MGRHSAPEPAEVEDRTKRWQGQQAEFDGFHCYTVVTGGHSDFYALAQDGTQLASVSMADLDLDEDTGDYTMAQYIAALSELARLVQVGVEADQAEQG